MLEVFGQLTCFLLHFNEPVPVDNVISSDVQPCKEKLRNIAEKLREEQNLLFPHI